MEEARTGMKRETKRKYISIRGISTITVTNPNLSATSAAHMISYGSMTMVIKLLMVVMVIMITLKVV